MSAAMTIQAEMSVRAVAERLGISRSSVYALINNGDLLCVHRRIAGRRPSRRVLAASVVAYQARRDAPAAFGADPDADARSPVAPRVSPPPHRF